MPGPLPSCGRNPGAVERIEKAALRLSLPDLEQVRRWVCRREAEFLAMPSRQCMGAHLGRMRSIGPGGWVRVRFDPEGRYDGEAALVLRSPGSDDECLAVRTGDGRAWEWPMAYLEPCDERGAW